ncbi:NACHT and WD repeat domain-containing protein [Cryptosporangium sp. NPDC048952]|uniref:NACHT and WD repeat domain-containing protein n=1 Tax=Cryptosporangium sp. NPDC048952 TaxID=3363961 RepID=UPI0037109B94
MRWFELRVLLIGVLFGFGTNLLTADPEQWWAPFRLVNEFAPFWVPTALLSLIAIELSGRWWRKRRIHWHSEDSPYPGLGVFSSDYSKVFFGRESETEEILKRITRNSHNDERRALALVGPSGAGKSSIIQAGVLPRLSTKWAVVGPIVPGADPFLQLAMLLGSKQDEEEVERDRTQQDARLLADEARRIELGDLSVPQYFLSRLSVARAGKRDLVVVLDQYEEIVTRSAPGTSDLFSALIVAGLRADSGLHLLVALRPEYLGSLEGSALAPLVANPYPIGPLSPAGMRRAIVKPAEAAGLTIDPSLVETMVAEATVGDALPLLGHLLRRLYLNPSTRGAITLETYEQAGRISGSIARHANEIYESVVAVFPAETVERLLLRFVAWDGQVEVRQQVSLRSLNPEELRIAEEFRMARLLIQDADGLSLALAHDALLRHWDILIDLVEANRSLLFRRTSLEQRALDWERRGKRADLLSSEALADIAAAEERIPLSESAGEFIQASRDALTEERIKRADEAASWAQEISDSDPELALAVAHAAVTELAPSRRAVMTLWGLTHEQRTDRIGFGPTAGVLDMVWTAPDRLLTVSGEGLLCVWDRSGALISSTELPDRLTPIRASFSKNAKMLATLSGSGKLVVWKVGRTSNHLDFVGSLSVDDARDSKFAWSQDGTLLATQFGWGPLTAWRIYEDRVEKHSFGKSEEDLRRAAQFQWAPDGELLAHFGLSRTESILKVITLDGDIVARLPVKGLMPKFFWSPDSESVLVIDDTRASKTDLYKNGRRGRVFHVSSGKVTAQFTVKETITAAAWHPDAIQYAAASGYGPLSLTIRTGKEIVATIEGGRHGNVDLMAWSPDGSYLAVGQSVGPGLEIYDLEGEILNHTASGSITDISWRGDREFGLAGSSSGTWLVGRSSGVQPSSIDLGKGFHSLDPGGEHAATWSWSSALVIQDLKSGVESQIVEARDMKGTQLIWANAGGDYLIRLFDVWDGRTESIAVGKLGGSAAELRTLKNSEQMPRSFAWSPADRLIAGGNEAGDVFVWSMETSACSQVAKVDSAIAFVRWSADSRRLAVVYADSKVRVLDSETGSELAELDEHGKKIEHAVWSLDGQYLATVFNVPGEKIRLWDPAVGEALAILTVPRSEGILDLWWETPGSLVAFTRSAKILVWTLPTRLDGVGAVAEEMPAMRELSLAERGRYGLPSYPAAEPQ